MGGEAGLRNRIEGLPTDLRQVLHAAEEVGRAAGMPVYLVGGFVRDLLLGRPSRDLDLVVEGDSAALAEGLQRKLGGTLRRHPRFLTAELELAGAPAINVVTARSETYPSPAALPEVKPGTLTEDLARRDFGINAIAWQLAATGPSSLIDPLGGLDDLARRELRVLHPGSFTDDPTRAWRGLRFEARLGFRFAPDTEELLRTALAAGAFARLSGSRLKAEVDLLWQQVPQPGQALARAEQLGLLGTLHPRLSWSEAAGQRFRELEEAQLRADELAQPPIATVSTSLGWLALSRDLAGVERTELCDRLQIEGRERSLITAGSERVSTAARSLGTLAARHQTARTLAGLSHEEQLLLWSEQPDLRPQVELYWAELCGLTLAVRGADLIAHGAVPGPDLGRALEAVRDARWDGRIGPDDELDFALEFLRATPPDKS